MAANDTDRFRLAWLPFADTATPAADIEYEVHLSLDEDFTPDPSTLMARLTGEYQTEITGLSSGTTYYARVVAYLSSAASDPSNTLSGRTYNFPASIHNGVTLVVAGDAGLGEHTVENETTYVYQQGLPPQVGSYLISESTTGETTLRQVASVSSRGSRIVVETTDAEIADIVESGALSSTIKLADIATANVSSRSRVKRNKSVDADGSVRTRMEWQDALLTAEQIDSADDMQDELTDSLDEANSKVRVLRSDSGDDPSAEKKLEIEQSFTVAAKMGFEPELDVRADWDALGLNSAEFIARGTLSATLRGEYHFAGNASYERTFENVWKKDWTARYNVGYVPIYQRITLAVDVVVSAGASAEVTAMAEAEIAQYVEFGVIYDDGWELVQDKELSKKLEASLSVAGEANAEIRLKPRLELAFYEAATGLFSVEPFVRADLAASETTSAIGEILFTDSLPPVMLTGFDVNLGLEAKAKADLSIFSHEWEIYPETCILGTTDECEYPFEGYKLFSLPKLESILVDPNPLPDGRYAMWFYVTDGINNSYYLDTTRWEVYPDDAEIEDVSCSPIDGSPKTCYARFTPGSADEYTVFASGHGRLGGFARQYLRKEITIGETGPGDGGGNDPAEACNSNNTGACTTEEDCLEAGGYWEGGLCLLVPSEECSSENLAACDEENACMAAGGSWENGLCRSAHPVCSENNLGACENVNDCLAVGGSWSSIGSNGNYTSSCVAPGTDPWGDDDPQTQENCNEELARWMAFWNPTDCSLHEIPEAIASCEAYNACVRSVSCNNSDIWFMDQIDACTFEYIGDH